MKASLDAWVGEAETLRLYDQMGLPQAPLELSRVKERVDDFYLSLVGELFDYLRGTSVAVPPDWAKLGNALAMFALPRASSSSFDRRGISENEAALFAAAAFYCGGFPASAYLTIRLIDPRSVGPLTQACYDFLAKPAAARSVRVQQLLADLRQGNQRSIAAHRDDAIVEASETLPRGLTSGSPHTSTHDW